MYIYILDYCFSAANSCNNLPIIIPDTHSHETCSCLQITCYCILKRANIVFDKILEKYFIPSIN